MRENVWMWAYNEGALHRQWERHAKPAAGFTAQPGSVSNLEGVKVIHGILSRNYLFRKAKTNFNNRKYITREILINDNSDDKESSNIVARPRACPPPNFLNPARNNDKYSIIVPNERIPDNNIMLNISYYRENIIFWSLINNNIIHSFISDGGTRQKVKTT